MSEQAAREAKAHAIADVLEPATREFSDEDVWLLRFVPIAVRNETAAMVDKRNPSEATWLRAVEIVEKRRAGAKLLASVLRDSLRVVGERKGA